MITTKWIIWLYCWSIYLSIREQNKFFDIELLVIWFLLFSPDHNHDIKLNLVDGSESIKIDMDWYVYQFQFKSIFLSYGSINNNLLDNWTWTCGRKWMPWGVKQDI